MKELRVAPVSMISITRRSEMHDEPADRSAFDTVPDPMIVPAVSRAMGVEIPRFPWSDPGAVSALASTLGATVCFHHGGEIAFTAGSPEQYLDLQEREHPLSLLSTSFLRVLVPVVASTAPCRPQNIENHLSL